MWYHTRRRKIWRRYTASNCRLTWRSCIDQHWLVGWVDCATVNNSHDQHFDRTASLVHYVSCGWRMDIISVRRQSRCQQIGDKPGGRLPLLTVSLAVPFPAAQHHQFQIILLGAKAVWYVLTKVVTWQWYNQESDLQPVNCNSDTHTVTLPCRENIWLLL